MRITYDTDLDTISSPDLTAEQTAQLQRELVSALGRNDPVQTVAANLMRLGKSLAANP